MITYLCGCIVPDAGGHYPTACVLHGRIVEPENNPIEPRTTGVLFTRAELTALSTWLKKQTFPYDIEAVQTAADQVIQRARKL